MSLKKGFLFLFFIFLIINSCIFYTEKKKSFYICSNVEYNKLFNDFKNIEKILIKYFNRNFYKVMTKKLSSYSGFFNEFQEIANKDKDAIIFVPDFLIYAILNNKDFFLNNKIITYNNKDIDKNFISIFDIYISNELLAETILDIIKKEKKSKDFSDAAIIFNNNYNFAKEIVEIIKAKNTNIKFFEVSSESQIKKFLESEKLTVVVLFGYHLNKILVDIDKENRDPLVKIKYIEIFSNYLGTVNLSGYSIDIIWENAITVGIHSKEFKEFLKSKEIKSYDFKISKNKNILKISKKGRVIPFFNFKKDVTSD